MISFSRCFRMNKFIIILPVWKQFLNFKLFKFFSWIFKPYIIFCLSYLKLFSNKSAEQTLAGEKKIITFNFSTKNIKIISGEIRTNDSPISFDNSLFFSFLRTDKVNVYCINQSKENKAINTLFNTDTSLFNFYSSQVNNINFNTLMNQDLIIILY